MFSGTSSDRRRPTLFLIPYYPFRVPLVSECIFILTESNLRAYGLAFSLRPSIATLSTIQDKKVSV